MTRRFLDNVSLGTLLAPMTEEQFRASYWEQKPLILHRAMPGFYGDLFSLEDFDRSIASAPAQINAADAKTKKHVRYQGGIAPLPLEQILGNMRQGMTLVLDSLHLHEPKLGLLCRLLEQQLGHRFQTNLYLTPPNGQGFTPHWDNHDVFILQVLGSKHWRLEQQRRAFPGKDDEMGNEGREFVGEPTKFTLNQGDMIYIPRGFVHAAECGSDPSLHITLGLMPYTWSDLLHATIAAAVKGDERLRRALPLGFMLTDSKGLIDGTKAVLCEAADETNLNAVVDRFRDDLVTKFPLDISGQVTAFFQAPELKPEDMVGPRPGIVYRLHADPESVRINFGGRTITFPEFFSESLKFALGISAYAIRDVGGDLEDEEKIVFIERLMQEGLVVRK